MKEKLTSRKFWVAIAGFVTGLITLIMAYRKGGDWVQFISGTVMSFGSIVSYIMAEGKRDIALCSSDSKTDSEEAESEG